MVRKHPWALQIVVAMGVAAASAKASTITSSAPSIWDQFQRGTSVIQWCEAVVANHAHSNWIAEYYNTWSNLALVLVALIGMKRCHDHALSAPFWLSEIMMTVVGLGSMLFHAHQSRAAQLADEIPMSLLALAQIHCLDGIHPWLTISPPPTTTTITTTSKTSMKTTGHSPRFATWYYWNLAMVLVYWLIYGYTKKFGVFETGFSIQITITLGLLYDAGRRLQHSHGYWYGVLGFIIVGKAVWELERSLYTMGTCDTPGSLLLHPLWHVFAALSHYCGMKYKYDLVQIIRGSKKKKSL